MLIESDPAKAIMLLNNQLINGGIGDRFVTLAAMIIDPVAHKITVVNAGHINPMKMKFGTPFADVISNADSGLPLGLVPDYPYEARTFDVNMGESVIVFTDGVTDAEAPNDSRFQHDGIHEAVKQLDDATKPPRPRMIGETVVRAVDEHANGRAQSDDIAFVCFGRVEQSVTMTTSTDVPKLVEPSSSLHN
jgi:sigma-B regulation protein RsbU (phosphoserine phosphatase)